MAAAVRFLHRPGEAGADLAYTRRQSGSPQSLTFASRAPPWPFVATKHRIRLPVALALFVAGCAFAEPRIDGPTPLGGTWALVEAPGIEITDGTEAPRIQFTVGSRIQGETGCADFSAPVRVNGSELAIGQLEIAAPQQICTLRRHAIEDAFMTALREVTAFSLGRPGDRLILSGPGGELVFVSPGTFPDP
jgi:heat shock protein HslJ